MSKVQISRKNMQLAQKSMKRLYLGKFGEDSLSDTKRPYTRDELIMRYAKNLYFWDGHLPTFEADMNEFTSAKHAICSNAISQLWKKVDEYEIRSEVTAVLESWAASA